MTAAAPSECPTSPMCSPSTPGTAAHTTPTTTATIWGFDIVHRPGPGTRVSGTGAGRNRSANVGGHRQNLAHAHRGTGPGLAGRHPERREVMGAVRERHVRHS